MDTSNNFFTKLFLAMKNGASTLIKNNERNSWSPINKQHSLWNKIFISIKWCAYGGIKNGLSITKFWTELNV